MNGGIENIVVIDRSISRKDNLKVEIMYKSREKETNTNNNSKTILGNQGLKIVKKVTIDKIVKSTMKIKKDNEEIGKKEGTTKDSKENL